MESTSSNLGKDGGEEVEENALIYAIESLEPRGENLVSDRYRRISEGRRRLILSIRKSRASGSCRELFLHNIHGSYNSIPKHITTVDEKYVLRCLELIRNCALRAATWNFTSELDSSISDHQSTSLAKIKNRSSNNMAIEYPLGGETEVIVDSPSDWTIGTVSGSQTMINILKSPLLQQFSSFDGKGDFGKTDLFDKDVKAVEPLHKRDTSISSSNSSFSDQSSSSYGSSYQGMLQCTWKGGVAHHVFTVDDKREVYVANLSKAESSYDKDLDYFYTFHLRRNVRKDSEINELEMETVAKMRVSTSITFSSNNSEVRETRFVLSTDNNHAGESNPSNQAHKKKTKKLLTRKMVDVFRSHKQRSSSSMLDGSSANFEDASLDPSEDVPNESYSPNLELAAIVVKDVSNNRKEVDVGGWGLKFLKKPVNNSSLESSRNNGECSTSMDVLIPAGFHGGPRTRAGGPSTLIERWISGGCCDCGGWDIGCPLKVLNTRSTSTGFSDHSGECKSVDLFMQGSKQNAPILKMVNIHKGLYYINFQSTLSTLQSFAISAAMLHSRSPVFRTKPYTS
ncbi:hypothetical protein ACS0TY_022938 [Phlomoides rotata]